MDTFNKILVLTAIASLAQAKPFLFGQKSQPQKETKHIYHIIQVPVVSSHLSHSALPAQGWTSTFSAPEQTEWNQKENVDNQEFKNVEHHYHTYDVTGASAYNQAPYFGSHISAPSALDSGWPAIGDNYNGGHTNYLTQQQGGLASYPVALPNYVHQQPLNVQIYPAVAHEYRREPENMKNLLGGIVNGAKGVLGVLVRGIASASGASSGRSASSGHP